MSNSARPPARRGPSGAWSRLRPAVQDPLDAYGLPSKGETRLHHPQTQESYHAKIVARYMKFCAVSASSAGEGLDKAFASLSLANANRSNPIPTAAVTATNPSTTTDRPTLPRHVSETPRPNDMPHILLAMRKLREGILGARRTDAFAQRAYMFIVQAAILTGSWESYVPALLYLLYSIHPVASLSSTELQDYGGYLVLDLACRQYELGEAVRVMRVLKLRQGGKVAAVVRALVHDDWVAFWRLRRAVDGYQRAVMEFAVERVRLHALKCLARSYLSVDKTFVERSADGRWEDLVKGGVGWELQEDGKVVIRRPKARPAAP